MSLPKAVIIRGDWLSKRDVQYYEPLMDRFDLLGVSVRRTTHDLSLVNFPVVSPWSVDSILASLGPVQKVLDRLFRLRSENLMYFFGLDRICENAAIIDVAETFHPFCRQVIEIKRRTGVPIVARAHENIPFAHSNLAYRRETKKLIFQHADAFITCSEMGRSTLEIEGAPPDRINVIPMGVDLSFYSPKEKDQELMNRLDLAENDFIVLLAVRMVWEKGVMDALNMFAYLSKTFPNLKLVIAGDGPDTERLPGWIRERGLEHFVRLAGRFPVSKMPDVYSIADVVIVPSIAVPRWQEQFGAVLIEAMACGRALVASDCGSIPEVVGDAGIIFPQANYVDLARAIQGLYNNRALLEDLGAEGRQRVLKNFSNEVVADQIAQVYNNIITAVHSKQAYITHR